MTVRNESVLNNSAFNLSYPRGQFLEFLVFRSAAGSLADISSWVGGGLFRISLKCSVHRSSISCSDDNNFPLLSLTDRLEMVDSCHSLPLLFCKGVSAFVGRASMCALLSVCIAFFTSVCIAKNGPPWKWPECKKGEGNYMCNTCCKAFHGG